MPKLRNWRRESSSLKGSCSMISWKKYFSNNNRAQHKQTKCRGNIGRGNIGRGNMELYSPAVDVEPIAEPAKENFPDKVLSPLQMPQMVRLVAGFEVMVTSSQLRVCARKARGIATAMTRLLLLVLFEPKILAQSCARGTSERAPLPADTIDALIQYCMEFGDKKTSPRDIVQAINGKCSDLRKEYMKKPQPV
ncbi:uncharacterized protein LOC121390368 [Gigantopelta aegis]|uniref:uncharacterized protein LOC121390368 n=1 Tax=Gigantopelta aegis TaxID=1735272 RepID=UPI001B889CE3|nr:uncharacterized protein LOC121390368 [Gigantopelta aegis]